ncbi:methyl-accepting chemotaxis protein [Alkalicoccus daliensis]|uniref:Methyl-accepting chemotaxis protein (MCP) signalling domain-containing protein n=1 Tax=Alkalicoccus daliensis TaxID=745820 RepID=A0A1H0DPM1_9BACI|nr:methyl-accepting chemotaxis protein [Alkalicoccus daliensis]SDN72130.1 Methyl-accepting chemotaxis protein (MCP) signalling domain-containing protein [Alkalicoccus daliensis]
MLGLAQSKLNTMTDEEIFEALEVAAPFFQEISKDDFMMDIFSQDTWLAHFPGKTIDVEGDVGGPVPANDPVVQRALQGEPQVGRPPFEVYNTHFLGKTLPIKNGKGKVIGVLGIGYNIEGLIQIEEKLVQTEAVLSKVKNYIEEIEKSASMLERSNDSLENQTKEVNESIKNIDGVLQIIDKVSSQTNILGLNASIEAARAGEHGRGFSVVADEVRKLASETVKASEKIKNYVEAIKGTIDQLITSFNTVDQSVDSNAELVDNFSRVSEELDQLNKEMNTSVRTMLDVS